MYFLSHSIGGVSRDECNRADPEGRNNIGLAFRALEIMEFMFMEKKAQEKNVMVQSLFIYNFDIVCKVISSIYYCFIVVRGVRIPTYF